MTETKTYRAEEAVLEIAAKAIADLREAVLRGHTDPTTINPYDMGQAIAAIDIAKAIARELPTEKQREFLTLCGIPKATL